MVKSKSVKSLQQLPTPIELQLLFAKSQQLSTVHHFRIDPYPKSAHIYLFIFVGLIRMLFMAECRYK